MPKDNYGREIPINPTTGEYLDLNTGKWYTPRTGLANIGRDNGMDNGTLQGTGGMGGVGSKTVKQQSQDVYLPMPGEDYTAWTVRLRGRASQGDAQANLILQKGSTQPEFMQQLFRDRNMDALYVGSTGESAQMSVDRKLKEFYDKMNGPLDMNDPEVRSAMAAGGNVAQRTAAGRGIRGGLSDAGIVKASVDSLIPIQQQRRELGLRALGMSGDRQQYADAVAQNAGYRAEDMAHMNAVERWNQQNADEQKWFGYATQAVGTTGSLVGGAASMGGGGGGGGGSGGYGGGGMQAASYGGANNINVSNGSATYMRPPPKGNGY